MGLGVLACLVCSVAAARVDQPFGPVLVALLLLMGPVRVPARG